MDTKILVVDDDSIFAGLLRTVLQYEGYEITIALSGGQALKKVQTEKPDLVLLDLFMGFGINGFEVCRRLRANPATAILPILIVSGQGMVNHRVTAFQAGADDFLTKPIRPDELTSRVEALLLRTRNRSMVGNNSNIPAGPQGGTVNQQKNEIIALREEVKRLDLLHQNLLRRIKDLQEPLGETRTIPIAELGRFVSGIAHDLRGGLGVICNTVGFMLDQVPKDNSLATDLHKIAHSAEFCELVVRNLEGLRGDEIFEPVDVNIEAIVREVFFILDRKLVDVKLEVDVAPDTPTIMADEGQMKQIFMNLIKNAGEAMPDGGTLSVRTQREDQMLRVEVNDTGCGILTENQDRIFHEFFTTKEQGYGLGLRIVNTIVKRHGGTIEVESKVDEGTTFILCLPIEPE